MSRGLPTNTAAEMIASYVEVLIFAKLEFPDVSSSGDSILYLHNGLGTYTWGGKDWEGLGDFGGVSSVEEAEDVKPYSITLTLSGLDSALVGEALTRNYYLRPVTLYLGALDSSDELVDPPFQIWAGHMDVMDLSSGSTSESGDIISLTCESELALFERSSNQKYTNQMLQGKYSGDLFYEFLPDIDGAKIQWRGDSNSIIGVPGHEDAIPPDIHLR